MSAFWLHKINYYVLPKNKVFPFSDSLTWPPKVAITLGVYIWLQSRLRNSTELLRLVELSVLLSDPVLVESSTFGD